MTKRMNVNQYTGMTDLEEAINHTKEMYRKVIENYYRKSEVDDWDTIDCSPPFHVTAKKYGIKFALKILLKQMRRGVVSTGIWRRKGR